MFDGREFLRLAVELLSLEGDEAAARSAVGRAYYAVYHVGRRRVEMSGGALSRGPAGHMQLAQLLGRESVALAQDLERLRKLRNSADYDALLSTDPAEVASIAVDLASEIIRAIDELPSEPF